MVTLYDQMLGVVYIYMCFGLICENKSNLTTKPGSVVLAHSPLPTHCHLEVKASRLIFFCFIGVLLAEATDTRKVMHKELFLISRNLEMSYNLHFVQIAFLQSSPLYN